MKKVFMVLLTVLVALACVSCGNFIGKEKVKRDLLEKEAQNVVSESNKGSPEIQDESADEEKEESNEKFVEQEKNPNAQIHDKDVVKEEYSHNYSYVEGEKTSNVIENTVEASDAHETNVVISDAEKKLIATGSTTFNPNQIERSSNIRLAASYINGLVLNPGEEFSFNNIVGRRTAERGFLPADIFVGQSVTKGYGGGICQTSSTICIAVKQTSMKILEQNPHSQRVTYTTISNEAMISYGTSDFRFKNTYDFPVLIEISFEVVEDREKIMCNIFSLE